MELTHAGLQPALRLVHVSRYEPVLSAHHRKTFLPQIYLKGRMLMTHIVVLISRHITHTVLRVNHISIKFGGG